MQSLALLLSWQEATKWPAAMGKPKCLLQQPKAVTIKCNEGLYNTFPAFSVA